MNPDVMFHTAVFDELATAFELLLDDMHTTYGHEFSESDLRWRETYDHTTLVNEAELLWKDKTLIHLLVRSPTYQCQCRLVRGSTLH